ncbi:hypothetical protein, partial [Gaiella sp.]|uniref:DF family (seleno)protein n=1 Tax=Gaiella sp. TaxID=2663207 RepID=UPI0039837119
MATPTVEILYFQGCPNHTLARELVGRVALDLGIAVDLRLVDVQTPDDAQRLGFLGSPTIRVNGNDVEPGAAERTNYAHSCRIYRTDTGFTGQPDERWVRDALASTHATVATRSAGQRLVTEGGRPVEVLPRAEYDEEHLPGSVIPLGKPNRHATERLALHDGMRKQGVTLDAIDGESPSV